MLYTKTPSDQGHTKIWNILSLHINGELKGIGKLLQQYHSNQPDHKSPNAI